MKLKSFSLKVALAGTLLLPIFSVAFAQTKEQNREAVALNNQALALGEEGRHEEALELYNRALAIGENQLRLYNRSFALYRLERYDEALKDINKVLIRGTSNVKALSQRARIYSALANHTAAFDDLTQALSLEPDNIQYAMRRGNAALKANKYVQALDSYYYTETLAQKQPAIDPDIANTVKTIPYKLWFVYNTLGLPTSSFTQSSPTSAVATPFTNDFKPKANELRFDGICSSINTKTGVFSFDTLAVSFPNVKTKVLPTPKLKVAKLSGVKIQNGHNLKISSPLKVGDFIVVVGKDDGKLISTRTIALGNAGPATVVMEDEE